MDEGHAETARSPPPHRSPMFSNGERSADSENESAIARACTHTQPRSSTLRGLPQLARARARLKGRRGHGARARSLRYWTKMAGGAPSDWLNRRGEGVENARLAAVNRSTIKIKISRGSESERASEWGRGEAYGVRVGCASWVRSVGRDRGRPVGRNRDRWGTKGSFYGSRALPLRLPHSLSRRGAHACVCVYVSAWRVARARVHDRH